MIYPKIIRGGNAIPIGDNLFLMKGRKHKNGGIDIGKDLEVEGGEVMQTSPNEIKVFSAQKFLGGESPAELILSGANPDKVFAAQEQYKDTHGINDDGTKKKAKGGSVVNWIKSILGINSDNTKSPIKGNDNKSNAINFDNLKLTNGRSYNPQYLSEIYDGLTKRGLSQNQAITVVGTIAEESGGDVFAKSDDKKYTGLLQWEDRRYKVQYPEDRDKELNAQLDYIADTLKNAHQRKNNGFNDDWTDGGEGSGYNSWKDAYKDFNDLTNVYNMTRGLNTGYVRPTGGIKGNTGSIKNRMNAAKQIFENNGITDLKYEPDKKQYGGMTNKENNANILGYVPSTGKRKKALMGSDGKEYTDVTQMPTGVTPKLHDLDWSDQNAYKAPSYNLNTGLNFTNNSKSNQDKEDIARGKRAVNAAHWLTYGLGAGTDMLSTIIGSSVEHSTTNKAINKMKELVGKLKSYNLALPNYNTHVEVEPQLAENRRTAAYLMRDIDANIYDSKKALSFKRKIAGDKVYKDMLIQQHKVNEENKLRNIKTKAQYDIINENIRNARNVENQKLLMYANIADKQSENDANLTRNIVGGVNSGIRTLLTGLNEQERMMIAGIDSPEGDNAIYGITGKRIREREEERERKRKEREYKRKTKNNKINSFEQNDLLIG